MIMLNIQPNRFLRCNRSLWSFLYSAEDSSLYRLNMLVDGVGPANENTQKWTLLSYTIRSLTNLFKNQQNKTIQNNLARVHTNEWMNEWCWNFNWNGTTFLSFSVHSKFSLFNSHSVDILLSHIVLSVHTVNISEEFHLLSSHQFYCVRPNMWNGWNVFGNVVDTFFQCVYS